MAAARGRDGSYRRAWPSAPAGPWAACSGTGSPPRAGSPQGGSWVSVHGAPGIGPSGPPHGCSCPARPPAHVPWPRCHRPLRLPPGEAGPLLGWPQAWRARSSDSHREALAPHISTFLAPFPGPDQIRWHLACENLDSGVLAVPQFPFGGWNGDCLGWLLGRAGPVTKGRPHSGSRGDREWPVAVDERSQAAGAWP